MIRRNRGRRGSYDSSDAELDAVLNDAQAGILDKLTEASDLEAGLAAIVDGRQDPDPTTPGTATAEDHEHAASDQQSEVEVVCAALARLVETLEPVARPDSPSSQDAGPAALYLTSSWQLLHQLLTGLSQRAVGKADAHRFLKLTEHNLDEAAQLAEGTRAGAKRRRARQRAETLLTRITDTHQEVTAVHPRVMRLFADADEPARVPTPNGSA